MRVHVALTPGEFPDLTLGGRAALVVDVLRATSMVVAAFDAGCARVIPVASAALARERRRAMAPERDALQGLMDSVQRDVTGTVKLKLYKGTVTVAGRRSPRSLYRTDFVTFEADRVYRQQDAEGFINLSALRLKIRALRDRSR